MDFLSKKHVTKLKGIVCWIIFFGVILPELATTSASSIAANTTNNLNSGHVNVNDLTVAIQVLTTILILFIFITLIICLQERQNKRVESLMKSLITVNMKWKEKALERKLTATDIESNHLAARPEEYPLQTGSETEQPVPNQNATSHSGEVQTDAWGVNNYDIYKQEMAAKKKARRTKKKQTKASENHKGEQSNNIEIIPESSSVFSRSFSPHFASKIENKAKQKRREKLKVIHSATSARRTSLQNDLKFAKEVIMPSDKDKEQKRRRSEKLKVVHSGARRESLLDQLLFALTTITPSSETRHKDKKAHEKRAVVRRSSSYGNSFLDDIQLSLSVIMESEEQKKRDEELSATRAEIRKATSTNSMKDDILAALSIINKARSKLMEFHSSWQPNT